MRHTFKIISYAMVMYVLPVLQGIIVGELINIANERRNNNV